MNKLVARELKQEIRFLKVLCQVLIQDVNNLECIINKHKVKKNVKSNNT